ncbi:single-stranded DNA-binding protein [Persephonella sp.]|uniref:single-stranded DNA-binding protein n=1 Tax=Persephonella sp. TaxID=2060922 RepID=UPI002617215C|nr:single-stranded DNA-binding protein [Persephonella sp.]
MLNKVFLIGRLTRDPEIRFLPSGSQVTSFSIAVNRPYRVNNEWKEETYFFDIETFGQLAERLGKQLNKGTQILVEGQLRQDRWTDAAGNKKSKIKIVADRVSILSGKSSKEEKSKESDLDIETEDFSSDEDVPF